MACAPFGVLAHDMHPALGPPMAVPSICGRELWSGPHGVSGSGIQCVTSTKNLLLVPSPSQKWGAPV